MTASMTTIDLIIKPRTELLEPVTTLFKLAAPSISSCALSIYFSQFLPLLLFSSYPLPTLTMDHKNYSFEQMWRSLDVCFTRLACKMRWRLRFCTG